MGDECPVCGKDCGLTMGYDNIGDDFPCASCGAMLCVEYEESFDGEEETQYWWLEAVRKLS